jgi:hypothetical protein
LLSRLKLPELSAQNPIRTRGYFAPGSFIVSFSESLSSLGMNWPLSKLPNEGADNRLIQKLVRDFTEGDWSGDCSGALALQTRI